MKKKDRYQGCAVHPINGKKILTRQIVEADLKREKPTLLTYISCMIGIGVSIALGTYVFMPFYLFVVNCLIGIKDAIETDHKLENWQRNFVLERPCMEKRCTPREDDPDLLQLWFSKTEEWNVAITVSREEYDATQEGDTFYLAFVAEDTVPWAWYNCKEWILDTAGWVRNI